MRGGREGGGEGEGGGEREEGWEREEREGEGEEAEKSRMIYRCSKGEKLLWKKWGRRIVAGTCVGKLFAKGRKGERAWGEREGREGGGEGRRGGEEEGGGGGGSVSPLGV